VLGPHMLAGGEIAGGHHKGDLAGDVSRQGARGHFWLSRLDYRFIGRAGDRHVRREIARSIEKKPMFNAWRR
jgi:hypothetical protein